MAQRQQRADRILDAAGELLLRWGYRKVTMEDVARRADIGKGTLYLHWRTKKVLFQAMLLREACTLLTDLVSALRADPGEVRPHRFLRMHFLHTQSNTLIHAMFTGNMDMLGALGDRWPPTDEIVAADTFSDVLVEHGLLRSDVSNLPYGMQATATGFFLEEGINTRLPEPDLEAKADLLAHTIRLAYEPADEPSAESISAAAERMCLLFEDMIATYQKWIYKHDPERPG